MAKISVHPKSGKVIRAVQITDLHLFAGSEGSLVGLNTEQSLEAVKEEVRANDLPADLILATGDLVHDDALISSAMCAVMDKREWRVAGATFVIQGLDPLDELDRGF